MKIFTRWLGDWVCGVECFTCDPVVGVMQVRTVVDEQVFNIREHLIHHLYADICDDARILNDISQAVLHQLRMAQLTCIEQTKDRHLI